MNRQQKFKALRDILVSIEKTISLSEDNFLEVSELPDISRALVYVDDLRRDIHEQEQEND